MNRLIICTVGTSLLTNRDDRPWAGWNPGKPDPLPDESEVEGWLSKAEPEKASAETNTLKELELDDSDGLALLHSDTPEGRFCANVLRKYYKAMCRQVTIEQIGRLGYGAEVFTSGLKALVDVTIRLVRKGEDQGRQPLFCATGGFKAEIAFLNLLGALLGIEVVYIHELHRRLVRLPRLPIHWDIKFFEENQDFFQWIDAEPRPSSEVESWLKGRPDLRPLVEDGTDGFTYLNAAGNLLFKAAKARDVITSPRARWPEPDPRPPSEKNQISNVGHHRPKGWERFVERLCAIDWVKGVRYDEAAYGGPRVKIINEEDGILGVRYGEVGKELPLRIETSARGKAQCELVLGYLRGLK
ncbi:MAG TPA: putative CRISPR-associated protein [Desulfobacterales bacterium]|nr:putative CRISPR-associated protein [Desulfobacterales bacterium]